MEENEFKFHVKAFDVRSTIAMLLFFSEKGIEYEYDIDTTDYTIARSAILEDLTTPVEFVKIFDTAESLFATLLQIQKELRDDFLAALECYEQDHPEWKYYQESLAVNEEQTEKILKFKKMIFVYLYNDF